MYGQLWPVKIWQEPVKLCSNYCGHQWNGTFGTLTSSRTEMMKYGNHIYILYIFIYIYIHTGQILKGQGLIDTLWKSQPSLYIWTSNYQSAPLNKIMYAVQRATTIDLQSPNKKHASVMNKIWSNLKHFSFRITWYASYMIIFYNINGNMIVIWEPPLFQI